MKSPSFLLRLSLAAAVVVGSAACSKPVPPQITPTEARAVGVSPAGLDLVISVIATNPNAVTLSVQSVTAKAKLDGKYDLGTVTINKPLVLPPNTPTPLEVPVSMPWSNANAIAAMATAPGPMTYTVDGTVKIGGESLNVDVPFSMNGTLTRDQLTAAALKSIPNIPGLPTFKRAP